MNRDSPRYLLVLGLVVTLLCRLAVLAAGYGYTRDLSIFHNPDTRTYVEPARYMLASGEFREDGGQPVVYRTPGYPLFLIPGLFLGSLEAVTIGLQLIVAVLAGMVVYRTGILLFSSRRAAFCALLLFAIEPTSALFTACLWSETLFTALLAVAVCLAIEHMAQGRTRTLLASAICFAAAAFVRPVGYYVALVAAAFFVVHLWRSRPPLAAVGRLLLFACFALVPLFAWQWRNYRATGYGEFSSAADYNLAAVDAIAVLESVGIPPEHFPVLIRECAAWRLPAARLPEVRRVALDVMRKHPWAAARMYFVGLLHTMLGTGADSWLRYFNVRDSNTRSDWEAARTQGLLPALRQRWRETPSALALHVLLGLVLLGYLAMAAMGAWRVSGFRAGITFLCCVYGALLLLSGAETGNARFRIPLAPALCLMAGRGAERFLTSRQARRTVSSLDRPATA